MHGKTFRQKRWKKIGRHCKQEYRSCQYRADPETSCHVDEFGVFFFHSDRAWLQRHTTLRTVAWVGLPDLWVHGTGVNSRPVTHILRCRGFFVQILFRGFDEFVQAVFATEKKELCPILMMVLGVIGDFHSTDNIFHLTLLFRIVFPYKDQLRYAFKTYCCSIR